MTMMIRPDNDEDFPKKGVLGRSGKWKNFSVKFQTSSLITLEDFPIFADLSVQRQGGLVGAIDADTDPCLLHLSLLYAI
jgi:hypothetical protein